MIQDVAERNGNMNVDVVTEALSNSTHRIMSKRYMTAALGDAGACHPRDNIALRYMADKLDLGYDLFDAIMLAREIQAENMAKKCLEYGKKVTIIGKAYKPNVPYTNGSASMLVGYYVEKHGGEVKYYDIHTGDDQLDKTWTDVYLIGYWENYVEQCLKAIPAPSVVVDPWRRVTKDMCPAELVHYGNTRKKKVAS
jgi:UDPglucose 6-dehydrogenase